MISRALIVRCQCGDLDLEEVLCLNGVTAIPSSCVGAPSRVVHCVSEISPWKSTLELGSSGDCTSMYTNCASERPILLEA